MISEIVYYRWQVGKCPKNGLTLRDRSGIPLGPDHEEQQAVSPIYGLSKA